MVAGFLTVLAWRPDTIHIYLEVDQELADLAPSSQPYGIYYLPFLRKKLECIGGRQAVKSRWRGKA